MKKMAPTYAVAVIPKKAFITWLESVVQILQIHLPRNVSMPDENDFYSDCPLFLMPPFTDPAELESYIAKNYRKIFVNCLVYWCEDMRLWPAKKPEDLTIEMFREFFDLEMHSTVYDFNDN